MRSGCIVVANQSTAYGKRRRWWEENRGVVAPDHVVDASCGDPCCFAPEHAFIRNKIQANIWKTLFGHVIRRILELPPGGNIGMMLAPDQEPEQIAVKLRSFLHINKASYLYRWAVRVWIWG